MKKKMETSKKLSWFSGTCFVLSIIYSVLIFTYGTYTGNMYDFTLPITLITTTGAVFGVTMASYMNKSRYENTVKIQKDFLKEKYAILQEIGVLDNNRAMQEIEDILSEIESEFDNEKSMTNQEITYNG
jgi:hypothetical protein